MTVQLRTRHVSQWLVISVDGRIDSANSGRVMSAFKMGLMGGDHYVAVDMTSVDFFGLAPLKELLAIAKELSAKGGELVLVGPNAMVRRHIDSFAGNKNLRVFQDTDELQTGICLRPRAEFGHHNTISF